MFFWQQTSFNVVDIIAIFQKQNNSCLKIKDFSIYSSLTFGVKMQVNQNSSELKILFL